MTDLQKNHYKEKKPEETVVYLQHLLKKYGMEKFGLMTDTEIVAANNFNMAEDANVDAMAWSWTIAAKIALGVAGAFL